MKYSKTVTVGGMTWNVIGRNERATTHEGRHFFAARCNPKILWRITEDDQNIAATGSAKPLRVWTNKYETHDLSTTVREICGKPPATRICDRCYMVHGPALTECPFCGTPSEELHPSMTFAEHRAAMQARRAHN